MTYKSKNKGHSYALFMDNLACHRTKNVKFTFFNLISPLLIQGNDLFERQL